MALIKCPECGREISDKAEACPNCAYPIAQLSGNHKTSEETEKTQGIAVQKPIDVSTHVERPEMTEEELRAREERRRKKREAIRIRKRKARIRKICIISGVALIVASVALVLIFKMSNKSEDENVIHNEQEQIDTTVMPSATTETTYSEKYQIMVDKFIAEGIPVYETGINNYDEVRQYYINTEKGGIIYFEASLGETLPTFSYAQMSVDTITEPEVRVGTSYIYVYFFTSDGTCMIKWDYEIPKWYVGGPEGEKFTAASAMIKFDCATYTNDTELTISDYEHIDSIYEVSSLQSVEDAAKTIQADCRYAVDSMLKDIQILFNFSPEEIGFAAYEFIE